MKAPSKQEILAKDFSEAFIEAMKNNVHQSWFKYGFASDNYARGFMPVDPVENALLRIERFNVTKNTNYLVDAANFLMYAFVYSKGTYYDPIKEHEDMYKGAAHKQIEDFVSHDE